MLLQYKQITGDNVLIARETARALGMGTDIRTPEGLPAMTEDGRMPKHLGRDYAHVILPADGFAQVRDAACSGSPTIPRMHSTNQPCPLCVVQCISLFML